jgi:cysteine desulfurase
MLPFYQEPATAILPACTILRRGSGARHCAAPGPRWRPCSTARETEVLFTSCGTESDNAAIRGVLEAYAGEKATWYYHPGGAPGGAQPVQAPGKPGLSRVTYLAVDGQGRLDLDALRAAINAGDGYWSRSCTANNETGVVFPIGKIQRDLSRSAASLFHTDAVQAAGQAFPGHE